ncbi:MAG: porin [Poseidonibacter sp.]
MKKIAKLSLVAAVAVAGLTNVNAASLEEAIKGVDVSGQFRFRAQEKTDNGSNSDVEVEVGVKVPVTDTVTAVFKIDNAGNHTEGDSSTKNQVSVEDYYFSYNANGVTVNAGQQNIPGRITDGAQGDGVVALTTMGPVTVGAAAFMNNNIVDGLNVYSALASANLGPVSLAGQYADVQEHGTIYNLKADASVAMLKVGAEYTERDLDADNKDYSTTKAHVSAKVGIVSAKLSYAKTADDGSGSLDQEIEGASEALLWNVGTNGRADYDALTIDASVAVTEAISLRAAYLAGEEGNGTNNEVTETLGQISYKVSKNLMTYVRYADVEDKGTDYNRGRVEVKYSF